MNVEAVQRISKEQGTPFYLFDEKKFIRNYEKLSQAFKERYPNTIISYAFKANHAPNICRTARQLGAYAEVSSEMEYYEATELAGYQDKEIVYNGVCKGKGAYEVIKSGGIVNIDSLDEARKLPVTKEKLTGVGVRIMLDTETIKSRFGIYLFEMDEMVDILTSKGYYVTGLHCHCSKSRSLKDWELKVRVLLDNAKYYFNNKIDFLDFGGGLFSNMPTEMSSQFEDYNNDWEAYAELVTRMIKEHYKDECFLPTIVLEIGTALVADTVSLVTEIVAVKRGGSKEFAVCNAGAYDIGEGCRKINYPVYVISDTTEEKIVDFTGNTCMEADVFHRNYQGKVGVGSIVVVDNVGAYSVVAKPPFITPSIRMFDTEGNVMKKEMTYPQVFEVYER